MTTPIVPTPDQQVPATPVQPVTTPSTPPEDYKPRFDGAVLKLQQLAEEKKALLGQLDEKSSTLEQLQSQLSMKDAEISTVTGQHQTELEALKSEFDKTQSQLSELQALQLKVEVAKELNRPELITIFDTIPNNADKDAIKKTMETVINFTDGQVKARETELTAGVTPSGGATQVTLPANESEWSARIGGLKDGSAEQKEAWDQYFNWSRQQR